MHGLIPSCMLATFLRACHTLMHARRREGVLHCCMLNGGAPEVLEEVLAIMGGHRGRGGGAAWPAGAQTAAAHRAPNGAAGSSSSGADGAAGGRAGRRTAAATATTPPVPMTAMRRSAVGHTFPPSTNTASGQGPAIGNSSITAAAAATADMHQLSVPQRSHEQLMPKLQHTDAEGSTPLDVALATRQWVSASMMMQAGALMVRAGLPRSTGLVRHLCPVPKTPPARAVTFFHYPALILKPRFAIALRETLA
jgi:hypothetical protein